jgi:hypothetical protein
VIAELPTDLTIQQFNNSTATLPELPPAVLVSQLS